MTEGRAEISSLGKVLGEVAERCAHDTALAAFRASRERAHAHGRLSWVIISLLSCPVSRSDFFGETSLLRRPESILAGVRPPA